MLVQSLQDVVTLLLESLLLSLLYSLVVGLSPSSFYQAWDLVELVVPAASLGDVESLEHSTRDEVLNLGQHEGCL